MLEVVKIEPAANLPYKNAPAKFRGTELVEAAGIEPEPRSFKTIIYVTMCPICASLDSIFRVMSGLESSIQRP